MKQCPFCKAELEDDARFCLYCMMPLTDKRVIHTSKQPIKRWQWIVAAAFVLVLIGVAAVAVMVGGKQPTVPVGGSTTTTAQTDTSATEAATDGATTETDAAVHGTSTRGEAITELQPSSTEEATTAATGGTTAGTQSTGVATETDAAVHGTSTKGETTTARQSSSTEKTMTTTTGRITVLTQSTGTTKTTKSTTVKTKPTSTAELSVVVTTVTTTMKDHTVVTQTTTRKAAEDVTTLRMTGTTRKTTGKQPITDGATSNQKVTEKTSAAIRTTVPDDTTTAERTEEVTTPATNPVRDTVTYLYRAAKHGDDFSALYEFPEDAIVITGVATPSADGVYDIPETIDGKRVMVIGALAFSDTAIRDTVKTVVLPSTVRTVNDNAFAECSDLTDIYFRGKSLMVSTWAFPEISKRSGTLTIHCAADCSDRNYRYYRNTASMYYDAEYAEWNGGDLE